MIQKRHINILIACEESQAECKAFRDLGFNAFSCDIQKCRPRIGVPAWHICGDVTTLLSGRTSFQTQDGKFHTVRKWHLIVAHPPCTYICKVGSPHMVQNGQLNQARFAKMQEAVSFFFKCLGAKADYVAVENPLPQARAGLPKPSFFVQPYWFGVPYSKKTLYWVRGLPPIMPTIINPRFKMFEQASRGKYRSRTFPEVARAIADQWGNFLITQYNES